MKQLQWDDQARDLMAASAAASPLSMLEGFNDCMGRSHLWELEAGGEHALFAVRGLNLEGGRLLEVSGLRSIGARMTPRGMAVAVEALARDVYQADALSMATRHAHLVRTCERAGWTKVGAIVVKPLRVQ